MSVPADRFKAMGEQLRQQALASVEQRNQKIADQKASLMKTLGEGSYSWANPLALRVKTNSYTAKNLPFSEIGIGLANYGWTEDNILQNLEIARENHRLGNKKGGHHDVYEYMMDQIGTFSDPKQAQLMKQFMETGNVPSGLTMDTVMQISDYGLRANARKQQRKKRGFLKGNIGAIIGTIGGAILGCYVGSTTGVGCFKGAKLGAKAGGAAGGTGQAINEDRGLLGTALAAYSGYTMGATAGNVASAAATGAQQAAQQAAIESGKATATETARKAGESALISAANIQQPLIGAAVNVGEQAVRSTLGSLTAPFKAAAAPVDTLRSFWNAASNPLQTFQSSGFYQGAVQPFVKAGQGLSGGIGSLAQGQGFRAGFTAGSGGYFAPTPSLGGVGSLANQPVMAGGMKPTPTADKVYYGDTVRPPVDNVINKDYLTGSITPGEPVVSQSYAAYENIPVAGAPQLGQISDPLPSYFGELGGTAATTGIGSLPTALYAKGAVKQILDPVTPEEYAEDKGFFTENNISRDMLDLDEAGAEEEAQLVDYGGTSVGQPAPFVPSDRLVASRRQLPDFERGALGRRVFGGDPITLQNQFDLSPYFRTPVFSQGGAVDNCPVCPTDFRDGGAVDAGQHKGFPFMKQLPTNMQSKFQAYESGTQSIMDSSGERVEEGYTRVSGSDMEPVEERYVKTPMGVQEFFSRTPNGQFRLMA